MTIFVSNYVATDTAQDNSEATALATDALNLIATDPGLPSDWCGDRPERLGLLKRGSETTLDMCKLLEMRESTGGVAYADAKAAMGFERHDFHIRGYPVYILDDEPDGGGGGGGGDATTGDLAGYRAAYVGNYTGGTESAESVAEAATLTALGLTFDDSSADGVIDPEDAGDKYEDDRRYLAAHLTTRLANLTYNADTLSLEHTALPWRDSHWQVVNGSTVDASMDTHQDNVLTPVHYLQAQGEWTYSNGADDRIIVARVDLTGYDSDDSAWLNITHYADGVVDVLDLGLLDPVDYGRVQVRAVDDATWTTVEDEIHTAGSMGEFATTSHALDMGAWAGKEVYVSLVWHTEASTSKGAGWYIGNVTVEALGADGATRLVDNDMDFTDAPYDVLVVGSNVDQNALTGNNTGVVKGAIQDWVTAGGDVVAVGSEEMDSGWISPFVKGAPGSSNGPLLLGISDPTHAILNSPHELDYFDWPASDKTYGVTSADTTFTQVLVREGGNAPETVLAASNPNRQYNGTLVVTSYTPHALGADARMKFMENALLYARFNALYLDYGPPLPPGATVGSANHAGLVDTSSLGLGVIDYRLVLYVWE